jgi:hypothetical protein
MSIEAMTELLDLTPHVRGLLEKYGKSAPADWRVVQAPPSESCPGLTLVPGWTLPETKPGESILPLQPWRFERRFQELRRMVEARTLEEVSMCRFSCLTDGGRVGLAAVLYREFDLAGWLTGSDISSVTASIQGGSRANIVLRMSTGVVCGVEVGVTLPPGTAMIDRHELIARRGVGCDRLVDSQVPQHSIYAFTADGTQQYTDTDSELFGLSGDAINLARAAYDALIRPESGVAARNQHSRLTEWVGLAFESDRRCLRMERRGA